MVFEFLSVLLKKETKKRGVKRHVCACPKFYLDYQKKKKKSKRKNFREKDSLSVLPKKKKKREDRKMGWKPGFHCTTLIH